MLELPRLYRLSLDVPFQLPKKVQATILRESGDGPQTAGRSRVGAADVYSECSKFYATSYIFYLHHIYSIYSFAPCVTGVCLNGTRIGTTVNPLHDRKRRLISV